MRVAFISFKKLSHIVFICVLAVIISIPFLMKSIKSLQSPQEVKYEWKKDHLYQYALIYETDGHSLSKNIDDKESIIKIKKASARIKGTLNVLSLPNPDLNKNNFFLQFSFKPDLIEFKQDDDPVSMPDQNIVFYVDMKKTGEIESIKMGEELFNKWGSTIREILSLMEFTLPTSNEVQQKEWTAHEKIFHGVVKTHFELITSLFQKKTITLLKSYLAETGDELNRKSKREGAFQEHQGHFEFLLDNTRQCFQEIKGDKVVKNIINEHDQFQNETHFSLKLLSLTENTQKVSYSLSDMISDDLQGAYMTKKMGQNLQDSILHGDSSNLLREKLLSEDLENKENRTSLFLKLRALFSLHPEEMFKFKEDLLAFDYRDERFILLVSALINVGLPEAQKLLSEVITLCESENKKQSLMTSLAFTGEATKETERFFRDLAQHSDNSTIQGTAHYSLGTVAHFLREHQKERSLHILKEYSQHLLAGNNEKRVDYLNVIGNIGLPEQVDVIRPYLSSNQKDIRRTAYSALRYVDTAEAHQLLVDAIKEQKDDRIREVAAEALSETQGDQVTLQAYADVLFQEHNRAVLRFTLNNLAKMKDDYPSSLQLIDQFISKCGGDEICRYAQSLRISLGVNNKG